MGKQWEKMSKSRGNVVVPDEVVYGVYELDKDYEFRFSDGQVCDWREMGVWRNKGGDGFFWTATRHKRQAVFLCEVGNPTPCLLLIDGEERDQHPNLVEYFVFVKKDGTDDLERTKKFLDENGTSLP